MQPTHQKSFSLKPKSSDRLTGIPLKPIYGVLMSLDKDAVLITEGEHTALPLFLLQDQLGIGKDVTILNLDLLSDTSYRERKLKESNLVFIENTFKNELKKTLCLNLPSQN